MATSPLPPHSNLKPGVLTANQKRKTIELTTIRSTVGKKPTKRTTPNAPEVGFSIDHSAVDDVMPKPTAAPSTGGSIDSLVTSYSSESTRPTVTKKTIKRPTPAAPSVGLSRNQIRNYDVKNTSTEAPSTVGFREEFDNSIFSESTSATRKTKRTTPNTPSVDFSTKDVAIDDVMRKSTPATSTSGLAEDSVALNFSKSTHLEVTKKPIKRTTPSAPSVSSAINHTTNYDVIYTSTETLSTDGFTEKRCDVIATRADAPNRHENTNQTNDAKRSKRRFL